MSCLILPGPHTIIFIPMLQIAHQMSPVYNSSKTLLAWPASQISKSIRVFLLGTASSTPSYSPIITPHVEKENSGLPIGWDCFSILHWYWSFPNNKKSQELCLDYAGLILTQEVFFTITALSVPRFQQVCHAGIDFQDQGSLGHRLV